MRQSAREKLLKAGEALMLEEGYTRTSVDAICQKAGVTKGSMYHYFKNKEELGIAVMDHWLEQSGAILMDGPHTLLKTSVEQTFSYLDHVDTSVKKLYSQGCLVGSVAMDMAGSSEKMQVYVEHAFKQFVLGHADMFQPILDASDKKDLPSAQDVAEMYLSGVEGAIILAKSYQSLDPLHRYVRNFKRFLNTLIK